MSTCDICFSPKISFPYKRGLNEIRRGPSYDTVFTYVIWGVLHTNQLSLLFSVYVTVEGVFSSCTITSLLLWYTFPISIRPLMSQPTFVWKRLRHSKELIFETRDDPGRGRGSVEPVQEIQTDISGGAGRLCLMWCMSTTANESVTFLKVYEVFE